MSKTKSLKNINFDELDRMLAEIEARRVRAVRIGLQIIALVLIVVALLLPLLARAATSADVEREITGAFERSEFSAREQWALAGMIVADIAGNESTIDAIGRGCRETNPLYGSRPNRVALYGVDALVWAGYWWAARRPGWRVEWFGYVRGVLSARQAWSNYRTEC